jgi:hypothetical protein
MVVLLSTCNAGGCAAATCNQSHRAHHCMNKGWTNDTRLCSCNCLDRTSLAPYHMLHGTEPVTPVNVQLPCIACHMDKGRTKNRCSRCSHSSVMYTVTLKTGKVRIGYTGGHGSQSDVFYHFFCVFRFSGMDIFE